MRYNQLETALDEAKRFIKRAEPVLDTRMLDELYIDPCKESGALRRASMDLTRALADLRR